jgi:hypothetical protein
MPGPAPRDYTGTQHGVLSVLARAGREESSRHSRWLCACSACGGRVTMRSTRLAVGHCGCLGYRRDGERHKAARAKVPARKRRAIARAGAAAAAAAKKT